MDENTVDIVLFSYFYLFEYIRKKGVMKPGLKDKILKEQVVIL